MTERVLNQRNGVRSTSQYHTTGPVSECSTPGQSIYLHFQATNDEQVSNTSQRPESRFEQPALNHNLPAPVENEDPEQGRQPSASSENEFHEAPSTRSKRTRMWMPMLILGILCLIVVPGLVVGIVTKEIPVGIALSGAIATVSSLFAGLYYYHNK